MKEQRANGQKLYKIRIYKDFEFPSFSINQENTLRDLYVKSLEEVEENFREGEYFELEISQILPFEFKEKENKENFKTRQDINFAIREICIHDLEDKFGKLDYTTNPDIFDKRTRNIGDGMSPDNSPYRLKSEIEQYFSERVMHYCKILENKII